MRAAFKDFRFARKANTLNLTIQIFLGVLLFLSLNFLAARHYFKFDISENRKNSLSLESTAYINGLKEPIDIYVTVRRGIGDLDGDSVLKDLHKTLSQYEYLSMKNSAKIRAHFINPHIESKKVEEIVSKFGKDIENSVIVSNNAAKKFKILSLSDLYDLNAPNKVSWKGEQAISSAMLSVTQNDDGKIYFLSGHGEMSYRSADPIKGMSEFASYLTSRNFKIADLNLTEAKQVPQNAALIVIAAPQATFLPREIDLLKNYLLKSNGNIIMFFGMGDTNGLDEILFDWGIRTDDAMVIEAANSGESTGGDLVVKSFSQNPHKIVRYLVDADLPLQFGSTRMVREDMGAAIDESIKRDVLMYSTPASWAEKNYKNSGFKYDEAVDFKGPVPVAMVASRTGNNDLGLKIPGGKLAVFGDEDFASNRLFNRLGNSKLLYNTVNWMLERDSMLNIVPRSMSKYSITLSEGDVFSLAFRFALLPAFIAIIGLLVSFFRR